MHDSVSVSLVLRYMARTKAWRGSGRCSSPARLDLSALPPFLPDLGGMLFEEFFVGSVVLRGAWCWKLKFLGALSHEICATSTSSARSRYP